LYVKDDVDVDNEITEEEEEKNNKSIYTINK
jgi:hypothetical protein